MNCVVWPPVLTETSRFSASNCCVQVMTPPPLTATRSIGPPGAGGCDAHADKETAEGSPLRRRCSLPRCTWLRWLGQLFVPREYSLTPLPSTRTIFPTPSLAEIRSKPRTGPHILSKAASDSFRETRCILHLLHTQTHLQLASQER